MFVMYYIVVGTEKVNNTSDILPIHCISTRHFTLHFSNNAKQTKLLLNTSGQQHYLWKALLNTSETLNVKVIYTKPTDLFRQVTTWQQRSPEVFTLDALQACDHRDLRLSVKALEGLTVKQYRMYKALSQVMKCLNNYLNYKTYCSINNFTFPPSLLLSTVNNGCCISCKKSEDVYTPVCLYVPLLLMNFELWCKSTATDICKSFFSLNSFLIFLSFILNEWYESKYSCYLSV